MKISVITVCFNSARTIADTLHSVAEQTHPDIEHIVIDGASRDNTLDIIKTTQNRVAKLLSEPDKGIYDAMNKGLALATGEVVGFLNSDDVYADKGCLALIASALSDVCIDACYGDVEFVSATIPHKTVRYWRAGEYDKKRLVQGWMPPHPTFYARRTLYDNVGGFDLRYRLQSDYDMAVRLLKQDTVRLCYLPYLMVRMRMGGASNASIGNILCGNLEAYRAAKENELGVGPMFVVRKILSRIPQFFARPDQ